MSDIHELAAQMAAGGPPDILAGSPKEEIGKWFREGFPRDGERSALAAAIVDNCSLLPTSLLRNIHELVLTHCRAATGIAVQDLEEANLIWDNVASSTCQTRHCPTPAASGSTACYGRLRPSGRPRSTTVVARTPQGEVAANLAVRSWPPC